MSGDPAIAAAQRAWDARYVGRLVSVVESAAHDGLGALAIAAAREALAPLREVVEQARTCTPYDTRDIGEAVLYDSFTDFLDELSALLYSSEELGDNP
ncbi:hypothetical protein SEA_PHABULOSO_81 [Gordonia phage Phabuloso]|nr:hypothetical protein SEA_PHABULOSO_81 [Gordonia phage Phabuloso]